MEDQKLENLLNLALDATEEEREKSADLETGYNAAEKTWELIVRYSGSLQEILALGIRAEELLGGYAILWVPQSLIPRVSSFPQIEYIEKPKRLFFAVNRARAASCLTPLQDGGLGLSGEGILVAVLDSGIDYLHQDFRKEDGSTRIRYLWDQVLDQVYEEQEINEALKASTRRDALELVPSVDVSGHGTAVAAIAAGNGRESGGRYRGVAYQSDLLVVKLGAPEADGFPRTTQLMRALDFVLRKAVELQMPVAVNISFGNTYGSHDGTSLLETFMDGASSYGRSVIVVGTGNEGGSGGHAAGQLSMEGGGQTEEVLLSVAPFEPSLSIQLWKSFTDEFRVSLVGPSGEVLGPFSQTVGTQRFRYGGTQILVYYGEPSPYSQAQEIFMDFIPERDYIDSGIWRIRMEPVRLLTGQYDLWLPSHGLLNPSTRFLASAPDTTLTIPSTASKVISVGAYNSAYQSYADFSGRGYTRMTNQIKPDLAAPGTDIVTAAAGGGYDSVTGTSFAAPFVTGTAALLMEWGILRGNDPYLYGEKVKARLQRGARQLPGFDTWPNPELGYGVLCGADSIR
ncbi:MAG: S8 family peptidase [Lachnospiraceae bacterium]|nr:S8 family peptidase [Lachnospiraceae bacterium]MDO5551095.1 S8 family peptidase [Lachnospiraceae bacterium]